MTRNTRTVRLATLVFLAAAAAGVATKGQSTPAPAPGNAAPPGAAQRQQNPPSIISRTQVVVVPVTVKDSRGNLVGDLQKEDFRVFSDNIEQKITGFSAEPVALSAVILLDNDLAERPGKQLQASLSTIAAGFGPTDEVAVVTYDEYPETVADFSANNDDLYTSLKRLELGTHNTQVIADPTTAGPLINGQPAPSTQGPAIHGSGRYKTNIALNDAVFAAAGMLQARGRERRKIIFLISDESNSGPNAHSFEETLHSLLIGDVSIYSISVTRTIPLGRSLVQRGASDIDKFVAGAGGDTYFADKPDELDRLYSDVTEEARNQYTLTFSPGQLQGAQDYHPIEVRVRRPGLRVETREGFYLSAIAAGR